MKRIAPQTYQIDRYVAFQTDRLDWKMGVPVFEDDPTVLIEETVTYHRTLRDCKSWVSRVRNMARFVYPTRG